MSINWTTLNEQQFEVENVNKLTQQVVETD
jgi:hypothetical protein